MAEDLPSLLALERLSEDMFRGQNASYPRRTSLYGGQVVAQCLLAAAATVEPDRAPHSLHGYFLRAGRLEEPVLFNVDRIRDGRSVSARRVTAVQEDKAIFSMLLSFHQEHPEPTYDVAPLLREVPSAENLTPFPWRTVIDVREVTQTDVKQARFTDCVWARSAVPLGEDPLLHRAALAFISDLGSGFGQQDRALIGRGGVSVDHAMWFHDDIRADEWVLIDLRPIKARSARGVYQGSLRNPRGVLGATLCQEQIFNLR